jgi:hypothetical protein
VSGIPPDGLSEQGGQPLERAAAVGVRARQLGPHEQAQSVRPRQEARVLELLVLADAVEAERLGELDIGP